MKIYILRDGLPDIFKKQPNYLEILEKSAKKLNIKLEVIYARECSLSLNNNIKILYHGKELRKNNPIFCRAGVNSISGAFNTNLIKQIELKGIKTFNSLHSIKIAADKWRTTQILTKAKIPIPKSFLLGSVNDIGLAIKEIGNPPYILKTIYGSQGKGVYIIESKRSLKSVANMVVADENNASVTPVLIQKFVPEAKGTDIRVFVVGNKIVAAMERKAKSRGEFRSNFHLGGSVKEAILTKEEKRLALRATKVVGLEIAGIDIIRTLQGPQIIEVNSSPGLEGITQATGKDIAGEILKYIVAKMKTIREEGHPAKK